MKHVPEEHLALFAGGEVSSRQARKIERHLASCQKCVILLDRLEETRNWIRQSKVEPSAGDLAELRMRVVGALRAEHGSHAWWKWLALPIASLVALFFIGKPVNGPSSVSLGRLEQPLQLVARVLEVPEIKTTARIHSRARHEFAPGIRDVQLLSSRGQPEMLRMTTADPNVVILLETQERQDKKVENE